MQRIDKILAHMGYGTRTELKKMLKRNIVIVNGQIIRDSSVKVDPEKDEIIFDGKKIMYREFIYLMLNKPQGVVSATEDRREKTVIELLDDSYAHFDLFPMGRLDKDTEGLLVLTTDGKLAHDVLSPKKHISKRYFAKVDGNLTEEDIKAFTEGIVLEDKYKCLPAQLIILEQGEISEVEVIVQEGKFHQIKRMFEALNKTVIYLKRVSMGKLLLDEKLALGEYRELTEEEINLLKQKD